MITWFRNALSGPLKWVFLGLVVVSFAAFGDFDLSGFGRQDALRVGDRAYSAGEVDDAFQLRLRVRQQDEPGLTAQEAARQGLLAETVGALQTQALFSEAADELGLTATDEMVQRYLRENPSFADPVSGAFDPARVESYLRQVGTTPARFREDLRGDLVRGQVIGAVAPPARAPEEMVRFLLLRQGERRDVRTAVVTAEDAPPPDEEALRSFYAGQADAYRTRELRTYSALVIDEASVAQGIEVPEADVEQAYEAARARLGEPERRSFRQAVFRDEEAARAAIERVRGGETLEAVARGLGVPAPLTQDAARDDVVDAAVREAVFAAEALSGQPVVVGPVEGTFGLVVAEVATVTPGTEVSFEDAAEALREQRRLELARQAVFDAIEAVELAFDGGATLAEAADAAGLPAPRRYGPVDADLFASEGAVELAPGAAHRAAFELGEGEESGLIELDDGGYAFVFVERVQPAAARPFEAVREQVEADFVEARREGGLRAATDAFEAAVRTGGDFAAAAEAAGSDVQAAQVSAARPDPVLPPGILQDLFAADIGEVVSAPTPDGERAVVAIVDAIGFEAVPGADALIGTYRDQLGGQLTNELVEAYAQALAEAYGVERDDALIAQRLGLAE